MMYICIRNINYYKNLVMMNKVFVLMCYYLGLWGFTGFLVTLIIGFVACCTNMPTVTYYILLGMFAIIGISATVYCIFKKCKKTDFVSL